MIVIVQNDPEVPAGTYGRFLEASAIPFELKAAWKGDHLPDPAGLRGAILLGGEMGVHDVHLHPFLHEVLRFITACIGRDIPLLGICLGGQLLAHALGGTVTPSSPHGEKGVHDVFLTGEGVGDPLFAGLPGEFVTFQWHNDSFDLPSGAVRLASSGRCPCQAFRHGRSYGIQFHPEVDTDIVSRWSRGEPDAERERLLTEFTLSAGSYRAASMRLIENFVTLAFGD